MIYVTGHPLVRRKPAGPSNVSESSPESGAQSEFP